MSSQIGQLLSLEIVYINCIVSFGCGQIAIAGAKDNRNKTLALGLGNGLQQFSISGPQVNLAVTTGRGNFLAVGTNGNLPNGCFVSLQNMLGVSGKFGKLVLMAF